MIFSWSYAGKKIDFSQRYNRIYYKYKIIPEINIHSCYEVAWISGVDHRDPFKNYLADFFR